MSCASVGSAGTATTTSTPFARTRSRLATGSPGRRARRNRPRRSVRVPRSIPTTSISASARATSFGPRTTPSTDVKRPGFDDERDEHPRRDDLGTVASDGGAEDERRTGDRTHRGPQLGRDGVGQDVEVGGPEGREREVHQQLARDGGIVRPGRHEITQPELEWRACRAARRRTRRDLEQIRAHAVTGSCVPRRLQREGRGRIHRRDPRTKEIPRPVLPPRTPVAAVPALYHPVRPAEHP